ncbi:MAG TPA: efflux RND transporter permease subunit [Pirellulales bacterium]|nr:efflux RND transporter permease subunit [Pirellulales bacterium]
MPVFMLSGREGKLFHPLAFTKSFAMIGVALISVTLVPALIPTFIKGRLRSEEDNPIVRSFINIYKPLLTWALPRRNLVMWMFAVLLILAAGMFPLQSVVGQGASEQAWQTAFLLVFSLVSSLTVIFIRGNRKLSAGLGLLLLLIASGLVVVAGRFTWLAMHRSGVEISLPLLGRVSLLKWLYISVAATSVVTLFVMAFRFQSAVLWRAISLASLVVIGMWAYHFPKIGVAFMPALDEGTTLDMPITVPRASVTESADDLKARDALLRGFPEVESVIGKAGRADTPTDPAPLDMVETFVNFRPKELWPKRVLRYNDAAKQTALVLDRLEKDGFVQTVPAADRKELVNSATQKAMERFDETMRLLALRLYSDTQRALGPKLVLDAVNDSVHRMDEAGDLVWPANLDEEAEVRRLSEELTPQHGSWLEKQPAIEDVTNLTQQVAQSLFDRGILRSRYELSDSTKQLLQQQNVPAAVVDKLAPLKNRMFSNKADFTAALTDVLNTETLSAYQATIADTAFTRLSPAEALALKPNTFGQIVEGVTELLGSSPPTFAGEVYAKLIAQRTELWQIAVKKINWELLDRGTETFTWYVLEELAKAAEQSSLLSSATRGSETKRFADTAVQAQLSNPINEADFKPFVSLRAELEKPFHDHVFLWPRTSGPKGDLVDDEMNLRVLQVPGWSNIFTQPIINRIDMLSTGVRTDIGVKVFGDDLDTIDKVCKEVEKSLQQVNGARDVVAAPIMGKGYVQIEINREEAARYGITVQDIQDEIEVALAGRPVTYTVEKRDRFPVRIRYARADRNDEESIRHLLISPSGMASGTGMATPPTGMTPTSGAAFAASADSTKAAASQEGHAASPAHAAKGKPFIPLSVVADVKIVEGPAMIKSENGRLLNYVTLNVRGRDMVGFVDEAQRVVAEKVKLPEGVHLEWSGEFEHQVRAARTLRFVFPVVIVLIFVILYLTYNDLADAGLMMLAVPEALAGGAFFMYLFPKIVNGWSAPPMDFSVAVWVGFIACFGMATETGIIMLVYLREAVEKRGGLANIKSLEELRQAVIEGAVHRLRPKLLTEGVAIIAIFPMVFAKGVGGEILAPMALPVLGGLLISDEVVDLFLPVRFYWVRRARWLKLHGKSQAADEEAATVLSLSGVTNRIA